MRNAGDVVNDFKLAQELALKLFFVAPGGAKRPIPEVNAVATLLAEAVIKVNLAEQELRANMIMRSKRHWERRGREGETRNETTSD